MKNKIQYPQHFKIITLFVFVFFNAIFLPAENIEDLGLRSETITMMDGDGTHDVCILSWNVKIFQKSWPLLTDDPVEQAEKICGTLSEISDSYNVLLMQEVWDPSGVDILIECLRTMGFNHYRSELKAGLLTVSRKPISGSYFEEYDEDNGAISGDCGRDAWKDKGFLYTEIEMEPGCLIHVINTHLDAGSCPDDIAAKRSQLRQLSRYLNRLEDLHCLEAILVGGDMNVSFDPNSPPPTCLWVVIVPDGDILFFANREDIPLNLWLAESPTNLPREVCQDLYHYMLGILNVTPAYDLANVIPAATNTAQTKILDYILFNNDADEKITNVSSRTLTNFDNPSDHQPVESCFTYECPNNEDRACKFDLSFTQFFCDDGDNLEITVVGNPDNPNHQWSIFLKGESAACQSNLSNTELIYYSETFRENRTTISLPYSEVSGRCLIIRYAVDGDCCDSVEGLAAVTVPEQVVCDYDPFFTYEFSEEDCKLEITGTALTESPYHIWKIHLLDDLEDCNVDNLQNESLIDTEIYHSRYAGGSETITLDMNYEDLVGRCLLIRHGTWSECCDWDEHLESFVVPEPVCNYDPHFSQNYCRVGNKLEITGAALSESPYHIWKVHLVDEGEDCDLDNLENESLTEIFHSSIASGKEIITLDMNYDDLVGRCLVITHGTWSECCDWRASREVITVPVAPMVNAEFTTTYENTDQYTYTANFLIPGDYAWTIESSSLLSGPWIPAYTWGQGTVPTSAQVISNQQDDLFYRVCNNVNISFNGVCSKATKCEIISPFRIIRSADETENEITKISENNISLFPNPASDDLTVENGSELDLVIELYSINGQMFKNASVASNKQQLIRLDGINSGFYLIQVKAADSGELIKTEKLIISK